MEADKIKTIINNLLIDMIELDEQMHPIKPHFETIFNDFFSLVY